MIFEVVEYTVVNGHTGVGAWLEFEADYVEVLADVENKHVAKVDGNIVVVAYQDNGEDKTDTAVGVVFLKPGQIVRKKR